MRKHWDKEVALAHWLCGWAHLAQGVIDVLFLGLIRVHLPLTVAKWCARHVYSPEYWERR